ncbi:hypothetical protein [Tsukamurella tyrosinosolvens]|uniref:hypothetical protein n=1 Tax=Tsukamurella tyrosinosolvens TaxID=57704 RepID=UPI0034620650
MAQRGELDLFQFGGNGPLYVEEDDLDAMWTPVAREVTAGPGARPTRAVPERPRGSAA